MSDENANMTFQIEKRINTELFIDRMTAVYMQKVACKNKCYSEVGKIVGAKEQR